jgi:hypothetical protein
MAVDSRHPQYDEFLCDWETMRDTFRGERVVKHKEFTYLPATRSMELDGLNNNQLGKRMYDAYLQRAIFQNFVSEGVETLLGMMWMHPPTIDLPEAMEPMRNNATSKGESLEMLLRNVNEEQLITGRVGLLLDNPSGQTLDPGVMPHVALYRAESILNWDDGNRDELTLQTLNFVALDESEQERVKGSSSGTFEWEFKQKTRILILGEVDVNEGQDNETVTYRQGLFREENTNFNAEMMIEPRVRGQTLNEIPFVFVNCKDIVVDPDDPPLIDLAKLCLAIYRGEADYRQSLFLQGQDTYGS